MWSLLSRNSQLTIIATSAIAVAWGLEIVNSYWFGTTASALHYVSATIFAIGTLALLFADFCWRWLWKTFPILERWVFPDLNGTWTGSLISTWIDPATGVRIAPMQTTINIRQGLFSTAVTLKTGESKSYSTRAFVEAYRDIRRYRVWYTYTNIPLAQFHSRSTLHDGVAYLDMDLDVSRNNLTGSYYTQRKTSGDLDLIRQ
jgi:hypothetical protein